MAERDWSTVSPSAKWLLLLKSRTTIPYAREAAALLFGETVLAASLTEMDQAPRSSLRIEHFEQRYRSVDRALATLGHERILELGAGLSFRGLVLAARPEVFYLDTDLPGIAELKRDLVARLAREPIRGTLRIDALDALDPAAVRAAAAQLPAGPIAVVNEGLLMYLGPEEKARLVANVHDVLRERGGHWITADIYLRRPRDPSAPLDPPAAQFLAEHRVEENLFSEWGEAIALFERHGLDVIERLLPDGSERFRETWVLQAKN